MAKSLTPRSKSKPKKRWTQRTIDLLKRIVTTTKKTKPLPNDRHIQIEATTNPDGEFNLVDTHHHMVLNVTNKELLQDILHQKKELPPLKQSDLVVEQKNGRLVVFHTASQIAIMVTKPITWLAQKFGNFIWKRVILYWAMFLLGYFYDYCKAQLRISFTLPGPVYGRQYWFDYYLLTYREKRLQQKKWKQMIANLKLQVGQNGKVLAKLNPMV